MMRPLWPLMVLVALSTTATSESSISHYYQMKEEGWFWREPMLEDAPEPTDASAPPQTSEPAHSMPDAPPLSPKWLREQLPVYRDRALATPTPQNVRAYYYLQRHAMNMAEQFALTAQKVVMTDPLLDENTRRPLSTYGAQVFDEVARENTWRVAAKIASIAGVWYFYRSDCPFCHAQNPILQRLRARLGLAILPIALDHQRMPDGSFEQFVADQGHAERFGVTRTPTLLLVRAPDQVITLAEGLVTDDGLLERMIQVAHEASWITQQEFESTRSKRPALGPIFTEVDPAVLKDSVALVELLRSYEATVESSSR